MDAGGQFLGRRIVLPLRAAELGVDWDDALSILGAEIEIKRTYAELLRSRARPDLFVDGGASYGTHSLLHLAHGVPAVAFEPNPRCHKTFRLLSSMNGVAPRLVPAALGEHSGHADLWFPEDETWIGTTAVWAAGRPGWTDRSSGRDARRCPLDDRPGADPHDAGHGRDGGRRPPRRPAAPRGAAPVDHPRELRESRIERGSSTQLEGAGYRPAGLPLGG